PGQMSLRKSFDRVLECLQQVYVALPKSWRLFTEHKPFEPAFYSTVVQDWGSSLLLAQALGPHAQCLVDLGHHLPNTNIELVVARLLGAGKLGGFHFNDSKYGDDDLTAGSIKPYGLFLIFHELVLAERERLAGFRPAYIIDQSHNIKDPIEDLLQTVDQLQLAYAKAQLVDHAALTEYQESGDVLLAERALKDAFETDARPLVAEARRRAGGALDPVLAFRASGYRARVAAQRSGGGYVPPQSLEAMAPAPPSYLAIDLGASSGRAVLGTLERLPQGWRVATREVHRFRIPMIEQAGHLYWQVDAVWDELRTALAAALELAPALQSVSVDSWAVDYVPLGADGAPLRLPYSYRDPRTRGRLAEILRRVDADWLYAVTGIQFLEFNTLAQVVSDLIDEPEIVAQTHSRLLVADYFLYRLSGRPVAERTMASTTQL